MRLKLVQGEQMPQRRKHTQSRKEQREEHEDRQFAPDAEAFAGQIGGRGRRLRRCAHVIVSTVKRRVRLFNQRTPRRSRQVFRSRFQLVYLLAPALRGR